MNQIYLIQMNKSSNEDLLGSSNNNDEDDLEIPAFLEDKKINGLRKK